MFSLSDFIKSPNSPLSKKQLEKVREWIDDDWESSDIDRNVIVLIKRLLLSIPGTNKNKTPRVIKSVPIKEKKVICDECECTIAYLNKDIKEYNGTDMTGGPDGCMWIGCPNCNNQIVLESW